MLLPHILLINISLCNLAFELLSIPYSLAFGILKLFHTRSTVDICLTLVLINLYPDLS